MKKYHNSGALLVEAVLALGLLGVMIGVLGRVQATIYMNWTKYRRAYSAFELAEKVLYRAVRDDAFPGKGRERTGGFRLRWAIDRSGHERLKRVAVRIYPETMGGDCLAQLEGQFFTNHDGTGGEGVAR